MRPGQRRTEQSSERRGWGRLLCVLESLGHSSFSTSLALSTRCENEGTRAERGEGGEARRPDPAVDEHREPELAHRC